MLLIKSRIQETLNLLTDEDSTTDTKTNKNLRIYFFNKVSEFLRFSSFFRGGGVYNIVYNFFGGKHPNLPILGREGGSTNERP